MRHNIHAPVWAALAMLFLAETPRLEQIIKNGRVVRGRLGITTKEHADRGALVAKVASGSPAGKNGIETGDIILEVNGDGVEGARELRFMISAMEPGSDVHLRISRNGEARNVTVRLEEMPEN